jgi:hypothetical protein
MGGYTNREHMAHQQNVRTQPRQQQQQWQQNQQNGQQQQQQRQQQQQQGMQMQQMGQQAPVQQAMHGGNGKGGGGGGNGGLDFGPIAYLPAIAATQSRKGWLFEMCCWEVPSGFKLSGPQDRTAVFGIALEEVRSTSAATDV